MICRARSARPPQGRHRQAVARTGQAAGVADQRLRLLRAVSHPAGREPWHSADKLNLVVVWREAPLFSARERAALAWTEALTLVTGGVSDEVYAQVSAEFSSANCLSHLGDRRDQRLEPARRRLSLDPAGAACQIIDRQFRSMRRSRLIRRDSRFGCVDTQDRVRGCSYLRQVGQQASSLNVDLGSRIAGRRDRDPPAHHLPARP